jgi:acetoin utilization protein AcuB
MITAADVMTEWPVTIRESTTVAEAARLLEELAVRHLPVINADDELVGMISDRDLRGAPTGVGNPGLEPGPPPENARVADLMSSDVVQVGADAPLGEVAGHMVEGRLGAVPVVDSEGRLLGIVSYVDILRVVATDETVLDEAQATKAAQAAPTATSRAREPGRKAPGPKKGQGKAAVKAARKSPSSSAKSASARGAKSGQRKTKAQTTLPVKGRRGEGGGKVPGRGGRNQQSSPTLTPTRGQPRRRRERVTAGRG